MGNRTAVIALVVAVIALAGSVISYLSSPDLTSYQTSNDVSTAITNATKGLAKTTDVDSNITKINAAVANRPTMKQVFGVESWDEIPKRIARIDTTWEDDGQTIVSSIDTTWETIPAVELAKEAGPQSPVEQFVAQPEVKVAIAAQSAKRLGPAEEVAAVPKKKKLPSIFQ